MVYVEGQMLGKLDGKAGTSTADVFSLRINSVIGGAARRLSIQNSLKICQAGITELQAVASYHAKVEA